MEGAKEAGNGRERGAGIMVRGWWREMELCGGAAGAAGGRREEVVRGGPALSASLMAGRAERGGRRGHGSFETWRPVVGEPRRAGAGTAVRRIGAVTEACECGDQ